VDIGTIVKIIIPIIIEIAKALIPIIIDAIKSGETAQEEPSILDKK